MTGSDTARWLVSRAASTSGSQGAFSAPGCTIRQTMRLSAGGRGLRLRFANPHTYAPLRFAAVTVALADGTSAGLASAPLSVVVEGRASFAVHPGGVVVSDPVPLVVDDLATIAISTFTQAPVELSCHAWASRTLWSTLGNSGDHTTDESSAAFRPLGFSWVWVDAVEVLDPDTNGAVVALGDSITDGAGWDFDTDTRWPDLLAERFAGLPAGDPRRRGVVNAGIGGNTVGGLGTALAGVNELSRLDRDVLSLSGVSEVLVVEGSNDLSLGAAVEDLAADLTNLADRVHAAGARVLVATIPPRVGGYLWTEEQEVRRWAANAWIRNQTAFDAVLDFEQLLDDPSSPGRLKPEFNADGTHTNSAGCLALASGIDPDLLTTAGRPPLAAATWPGREHIKKG